VNWRERLLAYRFYPLGEVYELGVEIANMLDKEIDGRSTLFPHDGGILAEAVAISRHGDHVEIGTFYGGSAILAALVKKKLGHHGRVYCVDPLEYRNDLIKDSETNEWATTEKVMANARKFGVANRIILVPEYSDPWPFPPEKTFASAYIDGDHWNGMPQKDWDNLSKCVKHAIVVDDYMREKSEIVEMVLKAAQDPRWLLVHISSFTAVLRRRQ
jgi:hypothetical protein